MRNRPYSSVSTARHSRRAAFTLIEIMLALTLFLVLLAVIFVPLNQAFQVFNAGRTSSALQAAADSTVKTIATELQSAVAVYPNADLPGITDRAPYAVTADVSAPPYFQATACSGTRVSNPARIDFVLPQRSADGTVSAPVKAQRYIITYFVQRQKAIAQPNSAFDEFSNPLGVYRAQTLYQTSAGATVASMNTASSRYASSGCDAGWLSEISAISRENSTATNPFRPAEAQIPTDATATATDERTLITPRDMAVNFRYNDQAFPKDYGKALIQPDLTFSCEDTDSNGVIDRVTIALTLVQYDESNGGRVRVDGQYPGQRVTAVQVVNLPNTRFGV